MEAGSSHAPLSKDHRKVDKHFCGVRAFSRLQIATIVKVAQQCTNQ